MSTDIRRDLGIWAGVLALVHFIVGLQVHMKQRWLYFVREIGSSTNLVPRTDLFGFANYTGLIAVFVTALLLALSNYRSLRRFGAGRWKELQRWNY